MAATARRPWMSWASTRAHPAANRTPPSGNGGLGRLAACFMESMAALVVPAVGYGIARVRDLPAGVRDGWQQEIPDNWLTTATRGNSSGSESLHPVRFGGMWSCVPEATAVAGLASGGARRWRPRTTCRSRVAGTSGQHPAALGRPCGRPSARRCFNAATTWRAGDQARAEAISRVLYPRDATTEGQDLRLRQEFSSPRPPSRISCGATCEQHRVEPRCRITPRSSSTTPIRHRGGRVDAPAGGRSGRARGRTRGSRDAARYLHQPHLDAGGAGDLARIVARGTAPAPHADYLPDQLAPPRGFARRGACDWWLDFCRFRRKRRPPRPHGSPRVPRLGTASTACPRCIRDLCAGPCSGSSQRSIPERSSTRRTASRCDAGCIRPIRG